MILQFNVDEQTVTRTDTVTGLVNESVDYLDLSFTFKSNSVWDSLDKKIEFYARGTGVYDLELTDDSVTVPFEVLTGDYFIFSLYGVDGDLRVTTNKMKVYLKESGFIGDGVAPGTDKRTVIEQINDRIDVLNDDVTGLSGSVGALSTNVSAIGDDVDSLESAVSGIGDDITTINGKLNNTVEMTVEYTDGTSATFDVVVK